MNLRLCEKPHWNFYQVTLNLFIGSEILMLGHPNEEQGMSLHLFKSSLLSSRNVF